MTNLERFLVVTEILIGAFAIYWGTGSWHIGVGALILTATIIKTQRRV